MTHVKSHDVNLVRYTKNVHSGIGNMQYSQIEIIPDVIYVPDISAGTSHRGIYS